jgi:hypothetical protein
MTNPPSFEEEYFDVLRAIETQIHTTYADNPDLLDFHVDKALNGLVRTLQNEQRGKKAPNLKLKNDEQAIYKLLQSLADLYLGKDDVKLDQLLTVDEMVACFKRIQRSIKLMSDQGRQGYVNFIKQFFGD